MLMADKDNENNKGIITPQYFFLWKTDELISYK